MQDSTARKPMISSQLVAAMHVENAAERQHPGRDRADDRPRARIDQMIRVLRRRHARGVSGMAMPVRVGVSGEMRCRVRIGHVLSAQIGRISLSLQSGSRSRRRRRLRPRPAVTASGLRNIV